MSRDEILTLLINVLGPLKIQPQNVAADFDKFQEIYKQSLSQPIFLNKKSGVQFPEYQSERLPEKINDELEKMADEIIASSAKRKTTDPVFWMRERNTPVAAGFEETLENFIEPAFSVGPFVDAQLKQNWFDFYIVSKQIRVSQVQGVIDYIVITLNAGDVLPLSGVRTSLSVSNCTVWIATKTLGNHEKEYIGIRTKRCQLDFSGNANLLSDGTLIPFVAGYTLSLEPFDNFLDPGNRLPRAHYPDKIVLSFNVMQWTAGIGSCSIDVLGEHISMQPKDAIAPVYLPTEKAVHLPLIADKNTFTVNDNDAERLSFYGSTSITDTGLYFPIVTTDNILGTASLGTLGFSGYVGFKTKDGLRVDWPNLEHGKLSVSASLVAASPSRMKFNYTYKAGAKLKQQLNTWKALSGGEGRSLVTLKPTLVGTGTFINDYHGLETLIQPVNISARADQPLNSAQQQFDITGHTGAMVFLKTGEGTSVYVIASRPVPVAGAPKPRRIPQSICLRNALLTTDDPKAIFLEGQLFEESSINQGFLSLAFPVFRIVNTLPDPYISNQDEIFAGDFEDFTTNWRTGVDMLPDQPKFSVTAVVSWNDEGTNLQFIMNQAGVVNRAADVDLLRMFGTAINPCGVTLQDGIFATSDMQNLRVNDPGNVLGAYGSLQMLPGDRTLVDVSGSANYWGVAFSSRTSPNAAFIQSMGYAPEFPFRIKNLDLVSSGRMSRLFTLPHIQWEPVMKVDNPLVIDNIPAIINFKDNGAPTRLATANKNEVALAPRKLYDFVIAGFNNAERPYAAAAHFTLPFGICAFAYFNPKQIANLPQTIIDANEPSFSHKKIGSLNGGMQLHVEPVPPPGDAVAGKDLSYFIGTAVQLPFGNGDKGTILGDIVTPQFNGEFAAYDTAKVPLRRIDFSGYGASIFSNWLNKDANFGMVSQVKFDVLIGRTAHEVVQIKSILFPWGAPVVRSIVMERKNTGIVTRYDTGWVAQGPGEFNFLSHKKSIDGKPETNPYNFHPGTVTGIYNIREIKDAPSSLDIAFAKGRFTGAYFNGDIALENIKKGALPGTFKQQRVQSVGQFGYVMLADPKYMGPATALTDLVPPSTFRDLLNHLKVGGNLGGPIEAVMDIAASGHRMHITRVDISASDEQPTPSFVAAVRGNPILTKEGSWMVVKCLPSKDIVPLTQNETVPLIRNGVLKITTGAVPLIDFLDSKHQFGNPSEIDKYAKGGIPALQYSFLQTTDAQKLLFRRPSFYDKEPKKITTEIPDFVDAFRLMHGTTIFPNLSQALSLPNLGAAVKQLVITGDGTGLKLDDSLFDDPAGGLNNFTPPQFTTPASKVFDLIVTPAFKVFIKYGEDKPATAEQPAVTRPGTFSIDLNSDPIEATRKKWSTFNKDVAIVVHLGPLQPMLTLRGQFRSEAGKDPSFEKPELELGPELDDIKKILQIIALLTMKSDVLANSVNVAIGNSPDSWTYKMSIDQKIPVMQFPSNQMITMSAPPLLIIEASLILGVFFNLSLSADPKNVIKPGAGVVLGFEGMIQVMIISLGGIAAYGVGITRVKAYVDLADPTPQFEFMFGFGATVVVVLPVVGMVSVTRSVDLTGSIDPTFKIMAGQMMRGVASLAGGLLIVAIQIEARGGVQKSKTTEKTVALFELIFSLDVSLAFVVSYDFTERWSEEITVAN